MRTPAWRDVSEAEEEEVENVDEEPEVDGCRSSIAACTSKSMKCSPKAAPPMYDICPRVFDAASITLMSGFGNRDLT